MGPVECRRFSVDVSRNLCLRNCRARGSWWSEYVTLFRTRMSSTYFTWLIVTLIGLVDKAKSEGPPWVR